MLQANTGDTAAGDRHGAAEAGEVEGGPLLVDPWRGGHLVHDEVDDVGVKVATGDPDVTGEAATLDDQVGQLADSNPTYAIRRGTSPGLLRVYGCPRKPSMLECSATFSAGGGARPWLPMLQSIRRPSIVIWPRMITSNSIGPRRRSRDAR